MTPIVLQALKDSIGHWEELSRAVSLPPYPSAKNCPLCREFCHDCDCSGCPVYERTGHHMCRNTPYDLAARMWCDWDRHINSNNARDRFRAAALEELTFLRSLLEDHT